MSAPLVPPPNTTSLYRDRSLPPPPFPKYQQRNGPSADNSRELRGGHGAAPSTVGTVADKSSSLGSSAITRGSGGTGPCSIRALGWSADGRRLATSATDRKVRIWTPERSVDHRAALELRAHTDTVEQLDWDPTNAECLATAAGDRTVRLWDIRSESPAQTIMTPGSNINISYHPQGHLVAAGDRNDTVSLLDLRAGKLLGLIRSGGSSLLASPDGFSPPTWNAREREEINEFCWTPDGSLFVLGTGGGNVRLLDAQKLESIELSNDSHANSKESSKTAALHWPLLHTIVGHTASIFCTKFDPLGRYLATASADSTVALWSPIEWYNVSMSGHLSYPPRSLSFSYDGEFLAVGGEDTFIDVTSTAPMAPYEQDSPLHKIKTNATVNSLAWHPQRYYLAYAGEERDGTVRIWGMPS